MVWFSWEQNSPESFQGLHVHMNWGFSSLCTCYTMDAQGGNIVAPGGRVAGLSLTQFEKEVVKQWQGVLITGNCNKWAITQTAPLFHFTIIPYHSPTVVMVTIVRSTGRHLLSRGQQNSTPKIGKNLLVLLAFLNTYMLQSRNADYSLPPSKHTQNCKPGGKGP